LTNETSRDFFTRACEAGHLAGFVQGAAQFLSCPQLASRRVFHTFGDLAADGTPIRYPATLAALSRTPMQVRTRAPRVGEHTKEALSEVGLAPTREMPPAKPETRVKPLNGIRVIDLSTVFAVPYIGGLLSDLGAEVIKVEAPRRLDQTRAGFGACFDNDPGPDYWNRATTFQTLNRGKRAIGLDLATEQGREILRELVRSADILLDNFTPRVMRKWGTTYDELREVNPRLVMLSNTGYGSTGPWASFKAQGTTLEVTMGSPQYTGYVRGGPMKAGQSYPDFIAAWTGLTALMSALIDRHRTGEGQWIDLGMYQLGPAVIPEALLHFQISGRELARCGDADLTAMISGVFPARGEDRWVAISVANAAQLEMLANVVPGIEPLLPGVADGAESHELGIVELAIANWTSELDAAEAADVLQGLGIAAGPVNDARDLVCDPQLRERGFLELADYGPELGHRPLIGRPYRWTSEAAAVAISGRAPRFGEANDYVLRELAGLDDAAIAELRAAGIVADEPLDPPPPRPQDLQLLLSTRILTRVDPDYREVLASGEIREAHQLP